MNFEQYTKAVEALPNLNNEGAIKAAFDEALNRSVGCEPTKTLDFDKANMFVKDQGEHLVVVVELRAVTVDTVETGVEQFGDMKIFFNSETEQWSENLD